MKYRAVYAILLLALALPLATAFAQDAAKSMDQPVVVIAKALAYNDLSVTGFPPGMKIAVLAGDPGQPAAYTIRLKFPDKYAFPPHWHPGLENVTVISGRFFLAMGEKVDNSALHEYHSGDFLVAPAHMAHYGRVSGETVVQLHGVGPFDIKVVGRQ